MKTDLSFSSDERRVATSEAPSGHVNEVTTAMPAFARKDETNPRPHILVRRNARWARRAAY